MTVKKAFEIDLNKINEGYLYNSIICHADNVNKAKSMLLKKVKSLYETLILKYSDEELTYLNIPVKRIIDHDKVIFEGNEVLRYQIEEIKQERERLQKLEDILNDKDIKYVYIRKGSYYGWNWTGYTSYRYLAGVYEKSEAISHAKSVRQISLEPCYVDEHNRIVNEKIAELQKLLLL